MRVFGFIASSDDHRRRSFALFPTADHAKYHIHETAIFLDLQNLPNDQYGALEEIVRGAPVRLTGTISLKKVNWDLFACTLVVDKVDFVPIDNKQ